MTDPANGMDEPESHNLSLALSVALRQFADSDNFSNIRKAIIIIFWLYNFNSGMDQGASLWSNHRDETHGLSKTIHFLSKSQCDYEMGPFCCTKEVKTSFRNRDLFDFNSFGVVPTYWAFFILHVSQDYSK